MSLLEKRNKGKSDEVKLPSDRAFGFFFSVVFLVLGGWDYFKGWGIYPWVLIASSILLGITLFCPKILRPFNWLWMKLADVLHRIFSPVILALVFYVVITPTSLLLRLCGKDSLGLRSKNKESYWLDREDSCHRESLKNQF